MFYKIGYPLGFRPLQSDSILSWHRALAKSFTGNDCFQILAVVYIIAVCRIDNIIRGLVSNVLT